MLTIENLHGGLADKTILKGLDLTISPGEVHVIMGPNGSGKSTLANLLVGKPGYHATEGQVTFMGENLLEKSPDQRARQGLFLSFQYPVEVPGVNNLFFLKTAFNNLRRQRQLTEMDTLEIIGLIKEKAKILELEEQFLQRSLNSGFSGGEKKRNEILQLLVLNPQLAILDEPDSGLDVDALQLVAKGINAFRSKDNALLIITHYQRLLNYVTPDHIHILSQGKIIKSGGKEIALQLEDVGYGAFDQRD